MLRRWSWASLAVIACLALLATPAAASRPFPETGYSVSNASFLDYFEHRGGVRTLGYPISREFDFLGSRVQFFQRAVLQMQPNGSVGLLNILDQGLLPYTRINGSTFPAPDPSLIQAAPSPSDPDYAARALEFVRANAPDEWQGMKTNFYSTFNDTVAYREAFPTGGDPSLLPLICLEMWGLPTSKPTVDPNNGNFVYLRFQRGIMHFDRTSGLTQGILVGEYLKAVITGQNLPPDLEQEARGSRLYRQYDNYALNGVARPTDLPATNLFAAFEKDGVVVPVPGVSPPPPPPATTQPPAAPASPAPVPTPTAIAITGSPWFVEQTRMALDLLAEKSPTHYANVRAYVFRIDETTGEPAYDIGSRALRVNEVTAFPPAWRSYRDNQIEWYAGLIVHNAVHIEQAVNGRAHTGYEAEQEARYRQKDAVAQVETTSPGGQFYNYITDAINGKEAVFGDWQQPRDPQ